MKRDVMEQFPLHIRNQYDKHYLEDPLPFQFQKLCRIVLLMDKYH